GADDAWEYKTKFAVGLQGALGVQLALGDRAAFYIEANGVSMNAYAKSGSMTKFTVNGIDRQSELDRSEKEITFDLSDTKSSSQSANEPDRAPTFSIPYSNIGIGVGLIFKL
ncbi:MAG TPA: hypothetical protein PL009_06880, partial [Flavipsychrobacter sp.]|nr:hypothetical protein [Flavipsychrobacter sp.]